MMDEIGKTVCQICGLVIYAWEDDCQHCGAHQDKEHLSIADRLRRAGVMISAESMQTPVKETCDYWRYDGSLEALRDAGVETLGDLLDRSVAELQELFPNKKHFRRILRRLPCPDTRPITDEENIRARLLGSVHSHQSETAQGQPLLASARARKENVMRRWPAWIDPRGPGTPIFEVGFEINLANRLYWAGIDTLADVAQLSGVDLVEAFCSEEQIREVMDCLACYGLSTGGAEEAAQLWQSTRSG